MVSEEEIKKNRPIRNKNCLWPPCLLTDWDELSNRCTGLSIDASYQVSVHLTKRFQRRFKKKRSIRNKELPVVAMFKFVNGSGRNVLSLWRTLHRDCLLSFGSFGQAVSEKIFKKLPIRNKNSLWQPCLLTDRDKMCNIYRGPSIYDSWKVSVH